MKNRVKVIECPRDAMQGLKQFIPTKQKAEFINYLLKVGFDTIDFGSFVSYKAIPQLKDTVKVLDLLDLSNTNTKLLSIIGNVKWGIIASQFQEIQYLGYPHSVSETFLNVNLRSNIEKSRNTINELLNICEKADKELVVYLSMAFGNPYGDLWSIDSVLDSINYLKNLGVRIISLSDTVGISTTENIDKVFKNVYREFTDIEIGFHLHTTPHSWYDKVKAAYDNNCRRFDSVINGLGGCPMAKHELIGNLDTSKLLSFIEKQNIDLPINKLKFIDSVNYAKKLYSLNTNT